MGNIAGELYASLGLSAIGAGLFLYGKKQHRLPHLLAGIALVGGPYFMPGTAWILVFGGAVAAASWVAARAGI